MGIFHIVQVSIHNFSVKALIEDSNEVWKLNFRQDGQMEKHSQEETRTGRKSEGRRYEMEKVRREKMQVREKVGKLFPLFCGSGGSKSRLAEAAGAEPAGGKVAKLWRQGHLEVKSVTNCHVRTTLGS